jgi:AraC family transcriptional regulator of adaptative response / DNA-3-methyladenine glycosylase II
VRAIVGQQISVRAARTLLGRLVARHGAPLEDAPPGLDRVFPSAAALAEAPAAQLAALGILPARARTLNAVARIVARGDLDLRPGADVDAAREQLRGIAGIGPWTIEYITLRALAWPDAFPAGDRVILAALGETRAARAEARSQAWRPWRAYAAMHLWQGAAA